MLLRMLDHLFPWFGDLLELGGGILLIIIFLAMVIWALTFERLLFFHYSFPNLLAHTQTSWLARSERESWYAQQFHHCALARLDQALKQHLSIIRTLIVVAPLLGLLGTVLGMLEVFDAVAATGANSPRATAAGVSKATISTMAGMVVAISGLLASGLINRRVQAHAERLRQLLAYQSAVNTEVSDEGLS